MKTWIKGKEERKEAEDEAENRRGRSRRRTNNCHTVRFWFASFYFIFHLFFFSLVLFISIFFCVTTARNDSTFFSFFLLGGLVNSRRDILGNRMREETLGKELQRCSLERTGCSRVAGTHTQRCRCRRRGSVEGRQAGGLQCVSAGNGVSQSHSTPFWKSQVRHPVQDAKGPENRPTCLGRR